jgi:site-specific DNA-methyltransferase (adenine-specific)
VKGNTNAGSTAQRQGAAFGAFAGGDERHHFADADGCEEVERFACVPECAVRMLDGKGTTSRFFYTAKVSRAERDHGCEALPLKSGADMTDSPEDSARLNSPRTGAGRGKGARNHHPTVKPQALMRWLCRLITPPGGTVFDPFTGSGSTAVAALAEGFRFVGTEASDEYTPIAAARITRALADTAEQAKEAA